MIRDRVLLLASNPAIPRSLLETLEREVGPVLVWQDPPLIRDQVYPEIEYRLLALSGPTPVSSKDAITRAYWGVE